MKILVIILLASVLLILIKSVGSIHSQTKSVTYKQGTGLGGIWNTKTQWKAHWVKHWEVKKIYVPVWRKVWGPVEVKEWIPFPQPPSEWTSQEHHH